MRLTDAGGGAGTWQVSLQAQAATAGTSVDVAGPVSLAPGGEVDVPVVAHAAANATPGENYGFVVFRRGTVTRRVPYFFLAERPALATAPLLRLTRRVSGDTRTGPNRVSAYGYPTAPFGNAPDTPPMVEAGGELLYWTELDSPAANIGVSLEQVTPGAQIDPFFLGAPDESSVQGFAGHARGRELADERLPVPDRRRRGVVPAPGALLRRRRLGPRPLHRRAARPATSSCAPG